MAKKKNGSFVFNDEKVKNSYGFYVNTQGIDINRFKQNPVMLDSHWKDTRSVLGIWENIKQEKGLLTGDPMFDSQDERVALIEGKVNRGFVKSCSMGISFDRDDLKYVEGNLILEKCELYEVSIVAIPANANSIRLYATQTGELIKEDEVQNLCLSIKEDTTEIKDKKNNNKLNTNMKITLTSAANTALGHAATAELDVAELSAKVIALEAQKKASELKLSVMLEAAEAEKLQAIDTQVEAALKAGKITADKKQKFVELGIANPELLTSTLDAIPAKKSFSATIIASGETQLKSVEDFQKLSHSAQLEFKQTQPEQYQKLFTKK